MQGYSPKLPLMYDRTEDGLYGLNKTLLETIKQNLKMLLLTNPGERIMDSSFGVGMKRYLFEQDNFSVRTDLQNKIISQVNKYLNYINIENITFSDPGANEENIMFVSIRYSVPKLNINDELNIQI